MKRIRVFAKEDIHHGCDLIKAEGFVALLNDKIEKAIKEGWIELQIDIDTETDHWSGNDSPVICLRGHRMETDEEFEKRKKQKAAERKAARENKVNQEKKDFNLYLKLRERFEGDKE